MVNLPVFLTSAVARTAKLSSTFEHSDFLRRSWRPRRPRWQSLSRPSRTLLSSSSPSWPPLLKEVERNVEGPGF